MRQKLSIRRHPAKSEPWLNATDSRVATCGAMALLVGIAIG